MKRRCCKLRGCCDCIEKRRQARSQIKISFFDLTVSVTCNQARPAPYPERQNAWRQPCAAFFTSSVTCIRSEPLSLLPKAQFPPATITFGAINPPVRAPERLPQTNSARRETNFKAPSRHNQNLPSIFIRGSRYVMGVLSLARYLLSIERSEHSFLKTFCNHAIRTQNAAILVGDQQDKLSIPFMPNLKTPSQAKPN